MSLGHLPQCRNKKYYNVETLLKSNNNIVERGQINALTHICMTNHSMFWLDAGTAMNNDGVPAVIVSISTVHVFACFEGWRLLTCGRHLHDRIISVRGGVWVH
jgi:hypothetical protein